MIKLGDKVKDVVSGLVGIAISKTEYMNGCVQFGVQPPMKKGEDEIKSWNIDSEQLRVIGKKRKAKKKDNGGPTRLCPSRY